MMMMMQIIVVVIATKMKREKLYKSLHSLRIDVLHDPKTSSKAP